MQILSVKSANKEEIIVNYVMIDSTLIFQVVIIVKNAIQPYRIVFYVIQVKIALHVMISIT